MDDTVLTFHSIQDYPTSGCVELLRLSKRTPHLRLPWISTKHSTFSNVSFGQKMYNCDRETKGFAQIVVRMQPVSQHVRPGVGSTK